MVYQTTHKDLQNIVANALLEQIHLVLEYDIYKINADVKDIEIGKKNKKTLISEINNIFNKFKFKQKSKIEQALNNIEDKSWLPAL